MFSAFVFIDTISEEITSSVQNISSEIVKIFVISYYHATSQLHFQRHGRKVHIECFWKRCHSGRDARLAVLQALEMRRKLQLHVTI